jgi:hypothetical protein
MDALLAYLGRAVMGEFRIQPGTDNLKAEL